ncbi:MAG: InlB B-repeat-containing protein [Planctomycetota bacterium]|jgi:hypothetical protein
MRNIDLTIIGCRRLIFIGAIIALGVAGSAYSQDPSPVLLLQQNPPEGGTMTPQAGTHHYNLHSTVVLTATPKPGYQFVCWLGDVKDPTSNSTVVELDTPKIVIAIFERIEFEFMATEGGSISMPIGGTVSSGGSFYPSGGFGDMPGGRKPRRYVQPTIKYPELPDYNDFPVPVPEPASVLLLMFGGVLAIGKRETKKRL